MTTCHCCATDQEFDRRTARGDMRRLLRRGPDPGTQQLLSAIREATLPHSPTLLDIGGGVGAIHHALLDQGFRHATHVDASTAYLAVAAEEALRLGHADRVMFQHADFRDVAADIPAADVVTLDRVVCCDSTTLACSRWPPITLARFLALRFHELAGTRELLWLLPTPFGKFEAQHFGHTSIPRRL